MIQELVLSKILNKQFHSGYSNHCFLSFSNLMEEAIWLSLNVKDDASCMVVVKENTYTASLLYERLICFMKKEDVILYIPEESLRVEAIASSFENKAMRMEAMYQMLTKKYRIVITSSNAIVKRLPNPKEFLRQCHTVKINEECSLQDFKQKLLQAGYTQVHRVEHPLTFSMRGGIIDVFSINYEQPIRIEFFDTVIDSLRFFDVNTQKTVSITKEVDIICASDVLFTKEDIQELKEQLSSLKLEPELQEVIHVDLDYLEHALYSSNQYHYYQYLSHSYTMLDYVVNPILLLSTKTKIHNHLHQLTQESVNYIQEMYEAKQMPLKFGVYLPLQEALGKHTVIENDPLYQKELVIREVRLPKGTLAYLLNIIAQEDAFTSIVLALKEVEVKSVIEYLIQQDIPYTMASDTLAKGINIVVEELREGFELVQEKIIVYSSFELFDYKVPLSRYGNKYKDALVLTSYQDLQVKDYVVHNQHGIGQYLGIETKEHNGIMRDYLKVVYKDNDELLVPLEQFALVRKFVSKEGVVPKLHKLGSNKWEKTKAKLQENVKDIAARLVALYSNRQTNIGFAYGKDVAMQQEFEQAFKYPLTEDQIKAVAEIKKDMESSKTMDRLLCGDVGFGKTEVAIRASFKAVINHKQVAFLCPTTILSIQHHATFQERFEQYPVRIEVLNRFVSANKVKQILADLKAGLIDILIGTHRLLSKDVQFNDLGFLIIDEEQRFGVEHKEKIKELKMNIDVLSLSATPIPRTLQMSLIGIRQLSTLDIPPDNRMPVQTFVVEKSRGLIIEAIQRELQRNGQVFYLHNNIEEIYQVANVIAREIKTAKVAVGHGQMAKEELENVMLAFHRNEYNVLICTTIIETGIDIPNANTILVDNAHTFGLSQLYQIKGRVGRSDRIAYAYFMVPAKKQISELAGKRLAAIKEFVQLGSGYKIAMRDLTIRGAGDLLGPEQSGFIDTVGIDMYLEMLDEAIRKEKGEYIESKPIIKRSNVKVNGYIPQYYAPEEFEKIDLYKRIDKITSVKALLNLQSEVSDMHGKMPWNVKLLFDKKYLDLLLNDDYVDDFKELKDQYIIKFSQSYSKIVNGIQLFENLNHLNKDITIAYMNQQIIVKVPQGKQGIELVIQVLQESKECINEIG